MANKKMTYAEALNLAINFLNENIQYGDDFGEVVERLEALKGQLAKRNSSGALKKPTKTQRENENFKVKITDILADDVDGMTATEIGSALGVTCQKASAILRQMVEANVVNKVKAGKVTRFVLA